MASRNNETDSHMTTGVVRPEKAGPEEAVSACLFWLLSTYSKDALKKVDHSVGPSIPLVAEWMVDSVHNGVTVRVDLHSSLLLQWSQAIVGWAAEPSSKLLS